ncbi:hypothetical protein QWY20_11020 [Alkalimonas sp. MEB108]|uniref:Big-1 domain-containing protein n=1 Tax=Alkalimonas cellulosilytica TaxID=3058395 RepID=A0ABU7J6E4_9GAMM|nr:hypothetical protein [Alkalimonas sp. MEB108]MEE2001984.1 hypothetical protein [Alkalimonas sp. MEB108]
MMVRYALAVAACLVALVLIGCGGDSEKHVVQLQLQVTEGPLSTAHPEQYRYVIATARNADGDPLVNASIEFHTTLGSFDNDTVTRRKVMTTSRGNADGSGRGEARLQLYPGAEAGTALVSIFSNGQQRSQSVLIEAGESGDPLTEVHQLGLSLSVSSLTVAGTTGQETSIVRIELQNADGQRVTPADEQQANLRVSMITRPGGGESLKPLPNPLEQSGSHQLELTTEQGLGQALLTAGTLPGVIELLVEFLPSLSGSNPLLVQSSRINVASGPAHSIAISYPIQNAIQDLGNGFYRRKGGLQVTDRYGNAVADDTVVSLGVLDTVLTSNIPPVLDYGFSQNVLYTNAGIRAGEASLTDVENSLFQSAYVEHNGIQRFIEPNDRVLLLNSPARDKSRFVAQLSPEAMTTTAGFMQDQDAVQYLVGAALKGIQVAGENAAGELQPGRVQTLTGAGTFYLTYPANRHTLGLGCQDPQLDTRYQPVGSAQVWLIAQVSDTDAAVVDNQGCYSALLDFQLRNLSGVSSLSETATLSLDVRDAAEIQLPFIEIKAQVSYTRNQGGLEVSVGFCDGRTDRRTNTNGACALPISIQGGQSGDRALLQLSVNGGNTIELDVTIPEN